jgi:endoglucanase
MQLEYRWNPAIGILERGIQVVISPGLEPEPGAVSGAGTAEGDYWAEWGAAAVLFDLYNEPHGISWRCWRDGCVLPAGWRTAGMQALVDAVRSGGARQPIIVTGLAWGNGLASWLRYRPHDPAGQLVAGFHVYKLATL